jgi:tRNA 2-thiouridine synthesizing protein A
MFEIDVRGYSCPIPVVKTKKAIDEHPEESIFVLVETAVSKENVSRLAESQGYIIGIDTIEDGFRLHLSPPEK